MKCLSSQEQRLYGLLLQDIRMKEIAKHMHLDTSTIDTYAKNIYNKQGVSSRIGLIIQFYTRAPYGKILGHDTDSKEIKSIDRGASL